MKVIYADIKTVWAIPEKKKKTGGVEDINVLKTPLEFLVFLLHPWKFQTKQGFTPRNSTNNFFTP